MSTRATASAIFPLPIDTVWAELRKFTFPGDLISTVDTCTMEDGAGKTEVGAIRTLGWKESGATRSQRLIELSDQHYRSSWELVAAEPVVEVSAVITTLSLYRVTETNETLVEWSSDFSSDVTNDFVQFEQAAYAENLSEMRDALTNTSSSS
eukprot:TRINITY_DN22953_c0_g1_i1.p1 TRINITY_DN22953_c0_g1~~TRINITY_DN22953_c0_g1_i1.p1  ORF type:complete len:152 (-),score=38.35 TRINITY_DN22953_c0_g1_i1:37-492(-)